MNITNLLNLSFGNSLFDKLNHKDILALRLTSNEVNKLVNIQLKDERMNWSNFLRQRKRMEKKLLERTRLERKRLERERLEKEKQKKPKIQLDIRSFTKSKH